MEIGYMSINLLIKLNNIDYQLIFVRSFFNNTKGKIKDENDALQIEE